MDRTTPACRRRFLDLLLTTDRHQRIRLAQAGLAALLMLASVVTLHIAVALGVADAGPLWWWTGASLVGMTTGYALIRSGVSRRWREPSLTLPQMLYSIGCGAWAYSFTGQAHAMALMMIAVILMFGMFGMTGRQVGWVAAYVLALFGGVMATMAWRDPLRYPPRSEALYFLLLTMMTLGIGVLTVRLHAMRDRLRTQKTELEAALARIQRLATHDDLTGLVNRRHMQDLLEGERQRSQRDHQPWCIALIDLDHFKRVNDEHGHAIGDDVLRALGQRAGAMVRRTDVLGRWGGEEFVLLLPNTGLPMAMVSLERLREHFQSTPVQAGALALAVSFSAGVTEHHPGESVAQTLERADHLAYRAKTLGRNRVEKG